MRPATSSLGQPLAGLAKVRPGWREAGRGRALARPAVMGFPLEGVRARPARPPGALLGGLAKARPGWREARLAAPARPLQSARAEALLAPRRIRFAAAEVRAPAAIPLAARRAASARGSMAAARPWLRLPRRCRRESRPAASPTPAATARPRSRQTPRREGRARARAPRSKSGGWRRPWGLAASARLQGESPKSRGRRAGSPRRQSRRLTRRAATRRDAPPPNFAPLRSEPTRLPANPPSTRIDRTSPHRLPRAPHGAPTPLSERRPHADVNRTRLRRTQCARVHERHAAIAEIWNLRRIEERSIGVVAII